MALAAAAVAVLLLRVFFVGPGVAGAGFSTTGFSMAGFSTTGISTGGSAGAGGSFFATLGAASSTGALALGLRFLATGAGADFFFVTTGFGVASGSGSGCGLVFGAGVGAKRGRGPRREPKSVLKTFVGAGVGVALDAAAGLVLAGADFGAASWARAAAHMPLRARKTESVLGIGWNNVGGGEKSVERKHGGAANPRQPVRRARLIFNAHFFVNPKPFPTTAGRCWAEIDLGALRHNAAAVRAQVGAGVPIMAVVTANAYGHGVGPVVRALSGRVEMFGVANVAEAVELRGHDAATPVFILGPALPEERAEIVARRFIPALSTVEEARAYSVLVGAEPLAVHLKIDTGMGRVGIWESEVVDVAREILALPGLRVTGLATHLPVADEDDAFTRGQLAYFYATVAQLRAVGIVQPLVHVENSAGIIGFPAQAGDLVRAGLMLYGSAPRVAFQPQLRAVMTWKTRITLLRTAPVGHGVSYGRTFKTTHPTRLATLAVGYADGYQRHLSGRGAHVHIRRQRCPVLGRVTMDQIVADVTALPQVETGDEVVLLGRQGAEEILAAELAEKAGTIAWEIFTGLGRRVAREYF